MYLIKMKLSIQVEKASNRAKWEWYKFYSVRGYGAPGRLEFICPSSGMVAKTIQQEEAASFRRYWANCAIKSSEILSWLDSVQVLSYTADLHTYLLRTIVITYNVREEKAYRIANPYGKPPSWLEL